MRTSPLVILALAALFAAPLLATPLGASAMVVPLDHTARLSIPGAAASVVVGNPGIADVTVVDSHTLYISGRGYGSTDLVVLDRTGRTLYSGDISVAAAGSSVSVYRAGTRTNVVCAPGCAESGAPTAQQRFMTAMADMMTQARTTAQAASSTAPPASSLPTVGGAPSTP